MLGFSIGAVSGVVQFLLLSKFTRSATGGKFNNKTVLFAVCQFLLPLGVLVGCAFLLREALIWTGAGIAGSLIVCAVVHFIIARKKDK